MDSSAALKVQQPGRQRRSIAEKRRIVELVMQPGASIARVAREHGVNANMVHYCIKLLYGVKNCAASSPSRLHA